MNPEFLAMLLSLFRSGSLASMPFKGAASFQPVPVQRPEGYQDIPRAAYDDAILRGDPNPPQWHPDANFWSYLPKIVNTQTSYAGPSSPVLQHFLQAGPSMEGLSGAAKLWGLKAGLPSHPSGNKADAAQVRKAVKLPPKPSPKRPAAAQKQAPPSKERGAVLIAEIAKAVHSRPRKVTDKRAERWEHRARYNNRPQA